jgi:hypothetical protein
MWLSSSPVATFCGYPVEQTAAAAAVDVPPYLRHTTEFRSEPQPLCWFSDKLRQHVHDQGAQKFNQKIEDLIEPNHRWTMALCLLNVKTGKRGYRAPSGYPATFSRLFKFKFLL